MIIKQLPNAAASTISVTGVVADLASLIATAAGSAFGQDDQIDSAVIVPEDGDVRILFDGNTPTATQGLLLKSGSAYSFSGFPVLRSTLIRTGLANVKVSVQLGQACQGDGPIVSPAINATVNVGTIELGDVKVGSPDGGTTKVYLKTETDGTQHTLNVGNAVKVAWDARSFVWTPGTFTEVITYYTGGLAGTDVLTATYIYTDATKSQLVSDEYVLS